MILSEQNMRDYDKNLREGTMSESKTSDMMVEIATSFTGDQQENVKILEKITGLPFRKFYGRAFYEDHDSSVKLFEGQDSKLHTIHVSGFSETSFDTSTGWSSSDRKVTNKSNVLAQIKDAKELSDFTEKFLKKYY